MAHLAGQSAASTADAADITSQSSVGGPTVEDDLTALNSAKAPKNNPTLTGTVTIPTATVGTSTTAAASCDFAMKAVGLVVSVAEDAAAAILNTTAVLYLASSTTGSKTITQTSTRADQRLEIVLASGSGGNYKLAQADGVPGGDLLLSSSGDRAWLYRNHANDGWLVVVDGAIID